MARFPLVEGNVTAREEIAEVEESLEGMIFLIEDNDTIREVLLRELESSGAQVIARADAIDAESVMKEHGQEIVLLVEFLDKSRTGTATTAVWMFTCDIVLVSLYGLITDFRILSAF